MAWFKKKVKEDEKNMTTLEQIRKAYDDLSDDDKKSFQQSIADRVHESIAAQERADGNEDSQSAAAREHEALGAEHADGKGDTSELHEQDDTAEERREDKADAKRENAHEERQDDGMKDILARVAALEARFANEDKAVMDEKRQKYGLGSHVVPQGHTETFTEKRIDNLLGK